MKIRSQIAYLKESVSQIRFAWYETKLTKKKSKAIPVTGRGGL
jgi:hypothetical protein